MSIETITQRLEAAERSPQAKIVETLHNATVLDCKAVAEFHNRAEADVRLLLAVAEAAKTALHGEIEDDRDLRAAVDTLEAAP